ncbi:MAG: DUF3604 domain-containing protein [Armatimonadota bacterium]
MDLYWGDMHAQFKPQWQPGRDWEKALRDAFENARSHLDFFPIVYYPAFFYKTPEGLHVESVGMRPEFEEEWELIKRLVREYHEPGRFVTFAGYEWTGDRTRWGDCNVFFNEDDPPLDLSLHIDDLLANLKQRGAIAIPHHTGYQVGDRGKDWDHHDEDVSPVAEIFSGHGSSEGCNTPRTLERNAQMSPRVSPGTVQAGLARGYRLGIIASNDSGSGYPGRWGIGRVAVYAEELTREGIWDALCARRTYGVTGDRIKLRFSVNDHFMGDVVESSGPARLGADVECTGALDRIEVIKNNRVAQTLCHNGAWIVPEGGVVRAKIPVEFGWGPTALHGFKVGERVWRGSLSVQGGAVVSAEGCFTMGGQSISAAPAPECSFEVRTLDRKGGNLSDVSQQTIVFEVEADAGAPLCLEVNGLSMGFTLAEAMRESELLIFDAEARTLVQEQFGIDPDTVENRDVFYHNAYIVKRHMAIPQAGYTARLEWEDGDVAPGRSFYYLRVSQLNGQLAWSSPVWVDRPE